MRIRKRWLPPPPPPPADLQSSSVSDHNTTTLTTPPIQSLLHRSFKRNQDPWPWPPHNTSRRTTYSMHLTQDPPIGGEDEGTAGEKRLITIGQRTDHHQNVETSAGSSMSSSFSNQEHWCEEDKAFPIKKRRAGFKSKIIKEKVMDRERNYKMYVSRENRKMNKKWGDEDVAEMMDISCSSAKKRSIRSGRSEKMVEEGRSRCSRVNGRGWRCYQPTIVGYSLCEHHRSIDAVARIKRKKANTSFSLEDDNEDEEEKKGLMVAKKKKRIGMMKARSISSLLDQTIPSPHQRASVPMI